MTHGELQTCISNCLGQFYTPESMPTLVEEMTFNDYVQIIGDGRNWTHFEPFFGNNQRKRTRTMLQQIGDLRNDVFHFRRQLEEEDLRHWQPGNASKCATNHRDASTGTITASFLRVGKSKLRL